MRKIALLFLIVFVLGLSSFSLHAQENSFDWRAHEGAEIDVLLLQNIFANVISERIPEFEELTGITVNLEVLPENEQRNKVRVELQAQSSAMDVFWDTTERTGILFSNNGWYEPLDAYLADPSMIAPGFDYPEDWFPPLVDAVVVNGQTVGIPLDRTAGPLLAYRKDILEELGIPVPTTFDELTEAIRLADEGTPEDVYGITLRGAAAQTTSQFTRILGEFGGAWEDAEGNLLFTAPETIAALDWYGTMLREYGPPGAAGMTWPDSNAIFLGGNAVFTIEDSVNAGRVLDPELSVIADTVGFVPIPMGPGGEAARSHEPCGLSAVWALAMSAFSDAKEPSWYFIQWALSTENQIAYIEGGRPAARESAWESEWFQEYSANNLPEYWEALREATNFCYQTPQFAPPSIIDQGRAREIIGNAVVASILGEDVEAVAQQTQDELEAIKGRQ